jgi:hypothetical protein
LVVVVERGGEEDAPSSFPPSLLRSCALCRLSRNGGGRGGKNVLKSPFLGKEEKEESLRLSRTLSHETTGSTF